MHHKIGFETQLASKLFNDLEKKPSTCNFTLENNHYIVIKSIITKKNIFSSKTTYVNIADPGFGILKFTKEQFEKLWNTDEFGKGVALLFEPKENFNTVLPQIIKSNSFKYFKKYLKPFENKFNSDILVSIIGCIFKFYIPIFK